jgi:DtxR family Mn-dependent transcriptional regulator
MYKNSISKQDYLKNIYLLNVVGKRSNTSSLAKEMKVSPASVSEMITKLSSEGLINNTPYHGFKLTETGEREAVILIRKHRLIEVFLQQHLDYKWDEVHVEAERLEHAVSDIFIDKLEHYLNYPKYDPHGDPIPDKSGNFNERSDHLISIAEEGRNYIVTKVRDESDELLQYVSSIGIKLNSEIYIKSKFDFDDSILVVIDNKEFLLSKKISEHIYVISE